MTHAKILFSLCALWSNFIIHNYFKYFINYIDFLIRVSGKIKNMGRIGFGSTEFGKNKQTKMHKKIINKFTDKNVKLKVDLKLWDSLSEFELKNNINTF